MKTIKMYSSFIIEPIENQIKILRIKIYKNKFSFTKKIYQQRLENLENLLLYYYQKLEDNMLEELEFYKKINAYNKY